MATVAVNLEHMSFEARLELAERVWQTLRAEPERVPVSESQAHELDRRLAELATDPAPSRPWREVLDEIPHRPR